MYVLNSLDMNIILFIALHFFSAFGIFHFFYEENYKNLEKLKKSKSLRVFIILIFTLGMIGNFFLSKYLLYK